MNKYQPLDIFLDRLKNRWQFSLGLENNPDHSSESCKSLTAADDLSVNRYSSTGTVTAH